MDEKLDIEINDFLWRTPSSNRIEIFEFLVKRKGIWEFHKYDKDQFPSKPHGHNKETGEKLNIYNGRKYHPITKRCTGILPERVLIDIQNTLKEKGFLEQ